MPLSFTLRRGLLNFMRTPAVEQLRFRNRPNLKNPLPAHWKRAKMLRLCEPKYAEDLNICKKSIEDAETAKRIEENLYAVFLSKKMRKQFDTHPMIAIFHWNSYTQHELLRIRGMLWDAKFEMEMYPEVNAEVARLALVGSKFEPVLRLVMMPTAFGFCKTTDMKKLLQMDKKMPAFILLAVMVDGKLLHKADFEMYASKDLNSERAMLSYLLSSAGGKTLSSTLQANSLNLSNSLSSYVSSNSSSGDNTAPDSGDVDSKN